jgi:hypothetical protein
VKWRATGTKGPKPFGQFIQRNDTFLQISQQHSVALSCIFRQLFSPNFTLFYRKSLVQFESQVVEV